MLLFRIIILQEIIIFILSFGYFPLTSNFLAYNKISRAHWPENQNIYNPVQNFYTPMFKLSMTISQGYLFSLPSLF